MDVADYTIKQIILWHWHYPQEEKKVLERKKLDIFSPLRKWLDNWEINDPKTAHRICKLIPSQCPFARTIKLWGITIIKIPPMCKLNPLYEELMGLRFRALSYLAEECGEDVSNYC